jgi:hypothetical protein
MAVTTAVAVLLSSTPMATASAEPQTSGRALAPSEHAFSMLYCTFHRIPAVPEPASVPVPVSALVPTAVPGCVAAARAALTVAASSAKNVEFPPPLHDACAVAVAMPRAASSSSSDVKRR